MEFQAGPAPVLKEEDIKKILFSKIVNIQQDEPIATLQLKEKVKQYVQERVNPFQKVEPPQLIPPCTCSTLHHDCDWTIQLPPPSNIVTNQQDKPFAPYQLKEKVNQYVQERKNIPQTMYSSQPRKQCKCVELQHICGFSLRNSPPSNIQDIQQDTPFAPYQWKEKVKQYAHEREAFDQSIQPKHTTNPSESNKNGLDFTQYKDIFSF